MRIDDDTLAGIILGWGFLILLVWLVVRYIKRTNEDAANETENLRLIELQAKSTKQSTEHTSYLTDKWLEAKKEIKELKTENAALKEENASLRNENAALRGGHL